MGHWQVSLEIVVALVGRVLSPRARGQLQVLALGAHIGGQRAIAVNLSLSAPDQFLAGAAVVLGKGVDIQWRVAASQLTKRNWLTIYESPIQ